MEIKLEKLAHQQNFLEVINKVFEEVEIIAPKEIYENPTFDKNDETLKNNINQIQKGYFENNDYTKIPLEYRGNNADEFIIDVRMETGTGKTYTYTNLMYELNKYGFYNFIILVPTLAIKEGTKNFIEANYTKNHFSDIYQGKRLTLSVLNAQKNTGKKRKIFPFAISNFTRVTNLQKNTINVLLTNSNMLTSSTMKDNYDQTLFGKFSSPYEALKSTKPIVIIDEPHRFKREDKAYNTLIEKINPLCIFRFGATFPEIKNDKNAKKDYNNLIFNLDSCTSFNQNLIKGVEIDMMPEEERNKSKFKVLDIVNNKETKYCVFKNKQNNKTYELKKDDTLNIMDDNFGSLKIQSIGAEYNGKRIKNAILLSNEQVLMKDDELYSDIYGNIYQDLMLQKAIKNHIDIERENFFRTIKIKTLSLFFIDSISSYRGDDGKGHLRVKFEKFLKEELKKELEKYSESNIEIEKQYCSFLQSSIKNISETNGGYFAEDNDKKDEDIAKEVETILRDKQSLVSFKDENGNWNIRRFIFSKWTLREGWDNPNVFQICKLRSSGSEISKLQEVGRGLRLPVDEYGNRISNEQFYLTYLVDYSEKDFANKLVEEINSEIDWKKYCVKPLITKISNGNSNIEKELFKELLIKDYIDIDGNIIIENKDKFFEEYPEFSKGLKNGKVITKDKKEINSVKIRKNKFEEIKQLWDKLNQKYYLSLEDISEEELYEVCLNILREGIYGENYTTFLRQKIEMKDNKANVITSSSNYYNTFQQKMYYGEFLKQIQKATGIPITIMHKALCEYNKENKLENKFFNKVTLNNFREKFESWFQKTFITRFCYKSLNINSFETALTNIKGEVKESIVQGTIGIKKLENFKVPDNFLYDEFIFDSDKEKENIEKSNIEEVVVFGKIPRNSIKIPLYFGGTTSPDFMYVVKKGKDYEVNLIIETKDANQNDIRGIEEFKIKCAENFFETMKNEGIDIKFNKQMKNDDILEIIKNLK